MSTPSKFEVVPISEIPVEDQCSSTEAPRVVLIVDDEPVIADTLSIILSKSGYRAMTACSGHAALELVETTPPDLLITDVMMPGMTGIELAIKLKEDLPDCKVLLFSGQAATKDLLLNARESGYDFEIMTKPVHPADMLRSVRECLALKTADDVVVVSA